MANAQSAIRKIFKWRAAALPFRVMERGIAVLRGIVYGRAQARLK